MVRWRLPWSASTRPQVRMDNNGRALIYPACDSPPESTIDRDIREIEDRGENIVPERDQARAQCLADDGNFREWLTREETGCLLVHGDYGQASHISGLSLFCNSLRRVLYDQPRFVPLLFFCGPHTGRPDLPPTYEDTQLTTPPGYDEDQPPPYTPTDVEAPDTRGRIMIRSLILQLVENVDRPVLVPMGDGEWEAMESGNIDALCRLFSRLVNHIHPDLTVWCLIDGVEHFEQNEFWNDMGVFLERLVRLSSSESPTPGASFRLLLTTPTSTSRMRSLVQESETIELPQNGWEHIEAGRMDLERTLQNEVERAHGQTSTPPRQGRSIWSRRL